MKKNISIIFLLIILVPSVAFASWWNVSSWKIFNFLHKKNTSEQNMVPVEKSYEDKISELQQQIEELKNIQKGTASSESSGKPSVQDEVKVQVAKELKTQVDQNISNNKEKTLSEQVGVSKDSLTTCMKNTDVETLGKKISTSIENATKDIPREQRGTPYAVVIGSNGVKTEIKGALPVEQVKKIIEEVKSGKVSSEYKGDISTSEEGDHLLGSQNASVKIIEYSDLECPYCKIFHATMKKVVSDSQGSVSWVYRHWPIHQNSFDKLVASECVAKLKGNDAFWKYLDLVFGLIKTGNESIVDQL